MTKQEVHVCDRCGATFNVPERNLSIRDVHDAVFKSEPPEGCGLHYQIEIESNPFIQRELGGGLATEGAEATTAGAKP